MCGINGIYGLEGFSDPRELIERMNRSLAHRGPDDNGVFASGPVTLGHQRLSIIDPSLEGKQPMESHDGRYVLVFNGEIYNFREIKKDLSGYPFKSRTDSEVLLAAFSKWGKTCLSRLNGMFAFAILDRETNELFLARDRMGIKPLYYYHDDKKFLFSSEIRSLLATKLFKPEVEPGSLFDYCRYQTVHAPYTILKDVQVLMPGHYMVVSESDTEMGKFWDATEDYDRLAGTFSYDIVKKKVREKLQASVEKRMVADVPFGAFLSGGIDSSIIVGLMSEVSKTSVQTFSVSFEDEEYSEAEYARMVAEKFQTDHHDIRLKPKDLLEHLPMALSAMDHPSGDGPNTYVVSKATRDAGVTMALSGLGGDELFAGYDLFKRAGEIENRKWVMSFPKDLRKIAGSIYKTLKPSVASQKIDELLRSDYWEVEYLYPLFRKMFPDKEIKRLLHQDRIPPNRILTLLKERIAPETPGFELPYLSRLTYAESMSYLSNVLLRDTDQMSMASALEVRVPFLDHDLVEFVLGVPDHMKYPTTPKKLLMEAFDGFLPEKVVNRPKMGFTFPWEEWLKHELRDLAEERIHGLMDRKSFNGDEVKKLWNAFLQSDPRVNWARVWYLIVLEDWIERNGVEA